MSTTSARKGHECKVEEGFALTGELKRMGQRPVSFILSFVTRCCDPSYAPRSCPKRCSGQNMPCMQASCVITLMQSITDGTSLNSYKTHATVNHHSHYAKV